MGRVAVDLAGQKFGRLIPLERDREHWVCACDCGALKRIATVSIKSGRSRSCGCLNSEVVRHRNLENNSTNKEPIISLIGHRFGRLVVESYECRPGSKSVWVCLCDCGAHHKAKGSSLKRSLIMSCGCLRKETSVPKKPKKVRGVRYAKAAPLHPRAHDLAGKKFGKLTAVHFAGSARWYCVCECGRSAVTVAQNLRSGNSQSCGCGQKATLRKLNVSRARGRSKFVRASVVRSGVRLNSVTWSIVCSAWGNKCAYCESHEEALTKDHVQPITRGGAHELPNIVPACVKCNAIKSNHELDFALRKLGTKNFYQRRIKAIVMLREMLHA